MAVKLYLPIRTVDDLKRWAEHRLKRNIAMAKKAKINAELAKDADRRLKNTKPDIYMYNDADRPIMVIGGGQYFRQELKEMAMKRAERPFLPNGQRNPKPNPMDTLHTIVDKQRRNAVGHTVFHIKSNPLSKEK